MKKINVLKTLLVLIGVLIGSLTTQMWATDSSAKTGTITVYFRNTVGWTNVYVYFYDDAYWGDNGSGSNPGGSFQGGPYTMTYNSSLGLFTYTYTGTYSKYISFTKDSQSNYANFWQTEAVYRADFSTSSPIFIPKSDGLSESKNSTKYYTQGEWVSLTTRTVYLVTNWATPYAYAYNSCGDQKGWHGAAMSSTSKKYGNKTIYSYTTLYDASNIIFNDNGSNQTSDLTLGSTNDGKLYDGVTANNWVTYAYDQDVTVSSDATGSVDQEGTVTLYGAGTELTASPTNSNTHYFTSWTISGGGITPTTSSTNPETFKAKSSGGTIHANFASKWALVGEMNSWNDGTNRLGNYATAGGKTTGYVEVDLEANTHYEFKIKDVSTGTMYKPSTCTDITYANKATAQTMSETSGGDPNQTITTAGAGTYTFTWNINDKTIKVTYPDSYTVTFGYGTGGSEVTATVEDATTITSGQYAAAGKDVTFTQDEHEGYTFNGWYDAASGGSAISCMAEDDVYEDIGDNISVYAQYTANIYTVTFDATTNGGSCGTASKSVTYDAAYGELPTATHASKEFIGWYTSASGEGTHITAESIVSTASDHTLYARYEDVFTVNVDFKCGATKVYPSTTVRASSTSLTPTITAPAISGYNFENWTGTNVTPASSTSATTTITATASTTITANYSAVPTVYFKNNLGWENVYVTFANGWESSAPTNNGKPYFQMTQIGSSDIFYCAIPDAYTSSDYAGWVGDIAFDNTGFESSDNVGSHSGGFNSGEFVGRGDFDPSATMFIPYNGDTESRNGGTYYKTGCWIQYNTNYSGYKVHVNSNVQGGGGTSSEVELRTTIPGSTEFTATVDLKNANYTYGVMLYKDKLKNNNDIWYTNVNDVAHTITSATTSLPWAFEAHDDSWQRCRVHTESLGDYKFTVSFATGKPMVDIEYPVKEGDWKLIYKDRATWSNGAHDEDWEHPSRVIKAKADALDTISFFVAYGSTPSIGLYKCTDIDALTGAQTWTKQGEDLDISSITATGYYNFLVTQNGSGVVTSVTNIGAYSGNFYIRTDASDGGWSNYKTDKNVMTYSEYADNNSGFTHYFMRYVTYKSNIKFCIANDYNECISDTLADDSYTEEWIEANGNVRFMWKQGTNTISRAYISGSSVVSDRFLVLEGSPKMFNENGTDLTTGNGRVDGLDEYEMNFSDDQNWIYEATIKAKPGANALLTAAYNGNVQYFGGSGPNNTDSVVLLGGTDTNKYKIRIVYDFKTNRLIKAFIPDGDINAELAINADMMIIREHQEDAQQITFGVNGKLSQVKTVYGAMKFNKYTVNGKNKTGGHAVTGDSQYKRDLFWISFPFDVKLNEAFGFGTYGQHWIIEYYDGKGRAANGYWADSESNWKFVMPAQRKDFIMKAFEGYILALDLDEMTESSSVWDNGVEDVYVYFPSSAEVEDIEATNRLISIDQTDYECTINRPTADGNRTIKDSYWHCIGVPSFADYSRDLTVTNGGAAIDWSDDDGTIDWRTPSLPYLYEWDWDTNDLNVTTSATFDFKATWSYLVQYAGATIYWSAVNVTPAASIAARLADTRDREYKLVLQSEERTEDQTFVRMTDDANVSTGFDFNYDLSKEFKKNNANIYTLVTTVRADGPSITQSAANVLPMSEQTTIVPVGVKIAANGEYTFSMPEGTNGGDVWLIDNANSSRTNLGLMDYTINLTAGTYEGRFSLEFPVQNVVTDIENAANANANANADVRKVFVGGRLYILCDGKAYDATGAQVR